MIIRVSRVLNIYSKFKTNSVKSKLWFGVVFLPLSFVFLCVSMSGVIGLQPYVSTFKPVHSSASYMWNAGFFFFSATCKPRVMRIELITLRINKFNHWLGYDKT